MDDAHVSELKGSTGSYTFNGSGVEIYTTKDVESRTAHYTLDGGGSSLWVGLNHYSPVTLAGCNVFRYPNLQPGTYTVGFQNAANPTGVNFSFVRLNIDALRVFKGESSSATPLFWGETAMGGNGIWDVGASTNWHDGVSATKWLDLGASDYAAVFSGKSGTVTVGNGVNANRLTFRGDGYTLQGGTITLTGIEPTISTVENVKATLAATLTGTDGLSKTGAGTLTLTNANSYSGGTQVNAGILVVGTSGTLGTGDLTLADGAVCQLENPKGSLAASARIVLSGKCKLHIGTGVTEKVAGPDHQRRRPARRPIQCHHASRDPERCGRAFRRRAMMAGQIRKFSIRSRVPAGAPLMAVRCDIRARTPHRMVGVSEKLMINKL